MSRFLLSLLIALCLTGCVSRYKAPGDQLNAHTSKLVFDCESESINGVVMLYYVDQDEEEHIIGHVAKGELFDLYEERLEVIVPANKPMTIRGTAVGGTMEYWPKGERYLVPAPNTTYYFSIEYFRGVASSFIWGTEGEPAYLYFTPTKVTRMATTQPATGGNAVTGSAAKPQGMREYYEKELQRSDLDPTVKSYYEKKLAELDAE